MHRIRSTWKRPGRLFTVVAVTVPTLVVGAGSLALDREPPGVASAPIPAPTTDAAAVSEARLVAAALEGVVGLTAHFTQTLESPALPSPQVERGIVYLLRPGRARFEYDDPKGKLAISDGRRTWLYLPEERQVLVAPLGSEGTRGGLSLLLADRIDLVGGFSATWGPATEGQERPLLLTPRSPRAEYRSLLIETDPDHLVRSLTVVDPLESRVTYRFSQLKRVGTLDAALFQFLPPPGVVVRETGP